MANCDTDEKKSRTLTQWIADFLAADAAVYEDVDHEPDDWDDGSAGDMPGGDDGFYDEIDEGILESLVIIGLAAALAGLVYWRQQMQLRRRQALAAQDQGQGQAQAQAQAQAEGQGQGQNQAQDQVQIDAELDAVMAEAEELLREGQADEAGLFPEPGDPAWNDWVVGGIGH